MSTFFLTRFLRRPWQIASILPASRPLVRRVIGKMDLTRPRVIVEYGPGEGCLTREIVRRMHPDSKVLAFELDAAFAEHLTGQFRQDSRVTVLHSDAAHLAAKLAECGHDHCDYIVSSIPFSLLESEKKRQLLRHTYECLAPHDDAAFIIFQITNELVAHCRHFPRIESEYCLQNIPPNFVTKYYKTANGHGSGANGHGRK